MSIKRLKCVFFVFWVGCLGLLVGCAPSNVQQPVVPADTAVIPEPPAPIVEELPAEPWILVDTQADTLTLLQGNETLEVFENIAIGSRGAGHKRWRGDNITPLGVFRVGWINEKSRFHLFIGLDYPNREYVERAYQDRRIDENTYWRIRYALEAGLTPPQDTPLGGYIGIHGIGQGDPYYHTNLDWTAGCVAVSNLQIQRLAQAVKVGSRVEIR